jgi:hypothetical protein
MRDAIWENRDLNGVAIDLQSTKRIILSEAKRSEA